MLKKICFLLWFIFPYSLYGAGGDDFSLVKDLKRNLLIYNATQQNYVPHAYNTPFRDNTASFILNLKEYEGLHVRICAPPESAIFIAQNIAFTINNDNCLFISIDSLRNAYHKESLFITLYNRNLNLEETSIGIVNLLSAKEVEQKDELSVVKVIERSRAPFNNFFIIGLLLLLSFFAMIKVAYPKISQEFYSWNKILIFRWRDDSIIAGRPISSVNLLFLGLYSLTMAFVIMALWFETGTTPQAFDFIEYSGFGSSLFSWFILAIFIFIALIVKYIIIYISSSLLGFKDLISFHFLDFIRISQLFLLLLLAITTFSVISFRSAIPLGGVVFPYIVFCCIFFTVILLFFKLLSASSYRNVHLFSYLCTTEILPLIIGIKFFLNI